MKNIFTVLAITLMITFHTGSELVAQNIRPMLEYVTSIGGGQFVATYGYNNNFASPQNIPVGSDNNFMPFPEDRNQPTTFLPGRQYAVFHVPFTFGSTITWKLKNIKARASTKYLFLEMYDNGISQMPQVGGTIKYIIQYTNFDWQKYDNTELYDSIPEGTSVVSVTGGGTVDPSGKVIKWDLPDLHSGEFGQVEVVLTVTAAFPEYKNSAWLLGNYGNLKVFGYAQDINSGSGGGSVAHKKQDYIAVYEDIKNLGWNDWDYNDLVIGIKEDLEFQTGTGFVNKITINYEALARGSRYDHAFGHVIKVPGNSLASLIVRDSNGAVIPQYTFVNEPFQEYVPALIFLSTIEALPPYQGHDPYSPTANTDTRQIGVIKGYTAELVIQPQGNNLKVEDYFVNKHSNPVIVTRPGTGYEQLIGIASVMGTIGNTQTVSDTGSIGSPLYNYYLDLAFKLPYNWLWPLETSQNAIWNSYPNSVAYVQTSGITNPDWYNYPDTNKVWMRRNDLDGIINPLAIEQEDNSLKLAGYSPMYNFVNTAGSFFASPKLFDIDGNGKLETFIGSLDKKFYVYNSDGNVLNGFPITTNGEIKSSAAIHKDASNNVYIAFANDAGEIYLVDENGQNYTGFPKSTTYSIKSSPVFADLFGNNTKQLIVFAGDGNIYAYNTDGNPVAGFPKRIQNTVDQFGNIIIMPTPTVYDLNGDGNKEIIAGTVDSTVVFMRNNGNSFAQTLKLDGGIFSSPTITKIDGQIQIIIATSNGTIYRINSDGTINSSKKIAKEFISTPVVADIDENGSLEILAASLEGKVYSLNASTLQTNWERPIGQDIVGSLLMADISGNGQLDLIVPVKGGYIVGFNKNGYVIDTTTMYAMAPFDSWLISTPAIGDIDGNGKLDVVAASYDKTIKSFEMPNTNQNSQVLWGMFGGNPENTNISPTDIKTETVTEIPGNYSLRQNYPNPFNPVTNIEFTIPESADVKLDVYDQTGRLVATLMNQSQQAGTYKVSFNANNLSSGVYFYKLTAGSFSAVKKMVLIK